MKIWIKRIGMTLLLLIGLVMAVGVLLPTEYSLSRSLVINAYPEQIHKYVGDLTKWDLWSPRKEEDPSMVTTFGEKTFTETSIERDLTS